MRSSAQLTLASVRAMLASSSRVMITTERLIASQNSWLAWRGKKKNPERSRCPGFPMLKALSVQLTDRGALRRLCRALRNLLLLSRCGVVAWRNVGHDWLFGDDAIECIFEDNAIAH